METNIGYKAMEPPTKKIRAGDTQTIQEATETSIKIEVQEIQENLKSYDPETCDHDDLPAIVKDEEDFREGTEDENYLPKDYNQVSQEELDKLKEFKVLDEVNCTDNDNEKRDFDCSEGIKKRFDENPPEDIKAAPRPEEKPYFELKDKIILEDIGRKLFPVLPSGWIVAGHQSGIPIYFHLPTRVCTLSKPYTLGKGKNKKRGIPISAIPCLNYRRALEEEAKQHKIDGSIAEQTENMSGQGQEDANASQNESQFKNSEVTKIGNEPERNATESNETRDNTDQCSIEAQTNAIQNCDTNEQSLYDENDNKQFNYTKNVIDQDELDIAAAKPVVSSPSGIAMPLPRMKNAKTICKDQRLTSEQVGDYCKKLFKFKTITVKRYL